MSGVPITLLDTAGIRSSCDTVEQLGVERSTAAAAAADVVIMVIDAAAGWTDDDGEIFDALWGKQGPSSSSCKVKGPALLVVNKCDLAGRWDVGAVLGVLVCCRLFVAPRRRCSGSSVFLC
jgi:tRNA modification GTPase